MSPMGPSFFIFFQQESGSGSSAKKGFDARVRQEAILKDDQEILELIQVVVVSGVLD